MANGDLAASIGLTTFAPTQDIRQGNDNDNIISDELAAHILTGTHPMANITGLTAALAGKQASLGFAPVQQGTGVGQAPAGVVKIGYVIASGTVDVQVDATDFGNIRFMTDGQFGSTPIFSPHARSNPATSSYVSAYINGDGRIAGGASSRRFKKEIRSWTPDVQAVLALRLVTFRYKAALYGNADAPIEVGLIAEELVELGLDWLVFYDEDGQPQGIHYERIALALLPVIQHHEADITELIARVTELETKVN